MRKKILILFIAAFFLATSFALARDMHLEARLERDQVSLGNPVYLSVTFYGAKNVPQPDISPVRGLQIKYVGPSTKISVVNGKISQSITHNRDTFHHTPVVLKWTATS